MYFGFEEKEREEYLILRDYYVYEEKDHGIVFIGKRIDEFGDNGSVERFFLPFDMLNNEFEPVKEKEGVYKLKMRGIDIAGGGPEKIVVQKGELETENVFNQRSFTPTIKTTYKLKSQ